MKTHQLDEMVRGWFVGAFSPTVLNTKEFEVAIQRYKAGDHEAAHVHRVATEITVLVSGRARMNGKEYAEGSIIVIEPGEQTDFEALTDCVNVVVKTPCVPGDKYLTPS
jgi:quercetin dioxygenase-like cupin family protein